jgi:hypothetical protein
MSRQNPSRHALLPAALMVLGLMPGTSRADIVFIETSPKDVKTDTNLGDYVTVDGDLNKLILRNLNDNNTYGQNNTLLSIETFTEKGGLDSNIVPGGDGQGFIELAPGAPAIGYGVVLPEDPLDGFTTVEFNGFSNTGSDGEYWLVAFDGTSFFDSRNQIDPTTGVAQGTYTFDGSGENRIAAVALNGQVIRQLEFFVDPPSADSLRQFRITGNIAAIPEASTMTMAAIVGLIPLGAAGVRRLSRRAVNVSS